MLEIQALFPLFLLMSLSFCNNRNSFFCSLTLNSEIHGDDKFIHPPFFAQYNTRITLPMDSRSSVMKKKKTTSSCSKEDDNGGAMVVAVRIRPLSTKEINAGQKPCASAINGTTIAIKKEGNAAMYLKSQQGSVNEYCFDSVFDKSSTQYDVYEKTTKRFIADVVDGYNVTVFAYGATGNY